MHPHPLHSVSLTVSAILGLAFYLAGCSTRPAVIEQDGLSQRIPPPADLASIPDATPREEPMSRYGNPPSYRVLGREYRTLDSNKGYRERGIASWYGSKFHGRRTSSGEPYDMYAMTAAHKTLPLPTYARVTNLVNGKKVVVKINDRGPFHDNRLIDLSYTAAWKLGIAGEGTGLVEIDVIDLTAQGSRAFTAPQRTCTSCDDSRDTSAIHEEKNTFMSASVGTSAAVEPKSAFSVTKVGRSLPELFLQVGAFGSPHNAQRLKGRLVSELQTQVQVQESEEAGQPLYRVHVGPIASVELCDHLTNRLGVLGISESHIVIR